MRALAGSVVLASLAVALAGVASPHEDDAYDLVLRGGRVVDGAGNPWYVADVAIRSGRRRIPAGTARTPASSAATSGRRRPSASRRRCGR